jgi:magnesium chelatase family protein
LPFHAEDLPKRNPHPCGYYGDSKRRCRCSSRQIETYRQRISGPLLDRIDLHVDVPLVEYRELSAASGGESSETIRSRVTTARELQKRRFTSGKVKTNSAMGARQVKEHCKLDDQANAYMEHAMHQMNFSARAHDRILKVARTLADLGGSESIRPDDVLEAIQYRALDRNLFQ